MTSESAWLSADETIEMLGVSPESFGDVCRAHGLVAATTDAGPRYRRSTVESLARAKESFSWPDELDQEDPVR
jgi:hypothetical protein